MADMTKLLASRSVVRPGAAEHAGLAGVLGSATGGDLSEQAFVFVGGMLLFVGGTGGGKRLYALAAEGTSTPFEGAAGKSFTDGGKKYALFESGLTHAAAEFIRAKCDFARPQLLGLAKSFGYGDRLGLATAGHIRSVVGSGVRPVLAQQSIRELERTNRRPEDVMDAAAFGVVAEGYTDGFGSDADHLKTTEHIDRMARAGFTMFTIDPGEHVVETAGLAAEAIGRKFEQADFSGLGLKAGDLLKRYAGVEFALSGGGKIRADEAAVKAAAVKYSGAITHTRNMDAHLKKTLGAGKYELEMSVDETEEPTTVFEHYFVAAELKRLGVAPVSLAPRFVGRFEKGVDYIGDIDELDRTMKLHAAIARTLGPYKLSIHSGSDKFKVYPIAAKYCGELVHVKTAGTSYLEAIRAIGKCDTALFRKIYEFAIARYETDKATYHVSADLGKVPVPGKVSDRELPGLLDQFDARQVFHVTFGSVLTMKDAGGKHILRDEFLRALLDNEAVHTETVRAHLAKHVKPFRN